VRRAIAIGLVLAVGAAAYLFWNSNERQIRRLLVGVTNTVNQEQGEGGVGALAEIAGLTSYLAPDVTIDTGPPFQPIAGAQDVVATVGRLRATMPVVRLEFMDVEVAVADRGTATAHATATLTMRSRDGADSVDVRDVTVSLEKRDGDWVIKTARAVPREP
jgi:hypothetical protein